MATLEAERLPVRKLVGWPEPPMTHGNAGRVHMTGQSIPGVLMLRCAALSHHSVRTAALQAGLSVTLEFAENRREFLDQLRRPAIDLVIAGPEGLPDIDIREVFERARSAQPPIPVVLAGDRIAESEAVRLLRNGAAEVLQSREMDHLPTVLARALKVRQYGILQNQAENELGRTVLMLRDNQKLITIGRLAASIAHEINNPLESITNILFLLGEEKDLSSSATGYLSLARRELDRVAQISRQTLRFSRETSGPVRVHIDELLEEVLSLYSRRIMEKSLHVERQFVSAEEAIVYPGEIRQVLSNLVSNALEASSHQGRLRLRVRSTCSWTDPGVRGIRVSIGDNGSGIPADVQRRLGEPFFTTKGQRGTGLGLWVTRSIIQRYGGEIQLRSSVSPQRHGTVFSIFLPTNMRPHKVDSGAEAGSESGPTGSVTPFPASGSGSAAKPSADEENSRSQRGA